MDCLLLEFFGITWLVFCHDPLLQRVYQISLLQLYQTGGISPRWHSIRRCGSTKNCTSKHKKRNGYVTSRWNVPGTRQNWHNAVFYGSTRRTDSWPMSWKPIGMPAYASLPRFRRKRSDKMKRNNESFPRSNSRRLPTWTSFLMSSRMPRWPNNSTNEGGVPLE